MPAFASRPAPPEVPPVEHDGVRYEQDLRSHDATPPGGWLRAVDARSGQLLWEVKVYRQAAPPPGLQAMGLYFRSLALGADRRSLDVESETGERYRVDLRTHAASLVSTPLRPAPVAEKPWPE
jgi:hypothetical protein